MVIMDKFLSLCTLSLIKCKLRALQIILVLSLRTCKTTSMLKRETASLTLAVIKREWSLHTLFCHCEEPKATWQSHLWQFTR